MLLKGYLDSKIIGLDALATEVLVPNEVLLPLGVQVYLLRSHEVDQGSEAGDPG